MPMENASKRIWFWLLLPLTISRMDNIKSISKVMDYTIETL
jgi:hypothetical protein